MFHQLFLSARNSKLTTPLTNREFLPAEWVQFGHNFIAPHCSTPRTCIIALFIKVLLLDTRRSESLSVDKGPKDDIVSFTKVQLPYGLVGDLELSFGSGFDVLDDRCGLLGRRAAQDVGYCTRVNIVFLQRVSLA